MAGAKRVTIRDVAAAAGVSVTTVSDSLSGNGRLPEATRERVRHVARALGYRVDLRARQFRKGRTGAIGLYIPDRSSGLEYYMNVALGAVDAAFARDYALTLIPASRETHRLGTVRVDGLIVVDPAVGDPALDGLGNLAVPVVSCERPLRDEGGYAGRVEGDNRRAVRELLTLLRARGARAVGLVGLADDTAWGLDVRQEYELWCAEQEVPPVLRQVSFISTPEVLTEAAGEVLDHPAGIDALICSAEGGALAALRAAEQRGLRVPDDVMIASCVDHSSLLSVHPRITAIDLHPRAMGRWAAELVADLLDGREPPMVRTLETQLVERESTAPRRADR